jgi:hypothetical protein
MCFSSLISIIAAPSFIVDALAAVTVPSFEKTAFKVGFSILTLVNSSSLDTIIGSPLRCGTAQDYFIIKFTSFLSLNIIRLNCVLILVFSRKLYSAAHKSTTPMRCCRRRQLVRPFAFHQPW